VADSTQSLEQLRAKHALEAIGNLNDYGNFLSYVNALPAAIRTNGLGQAMATERAGSKDDKGHGKLYKALNDWLCRDDSWAPYPRGMDLIEAIVKNGEAHYLRAQAEALAYLVWLKKFARAQLEPGSED